MGKKVKDLTYNYKGLQLPVKVHFERRTSSRVALGREAILLRVPSLCRGPLLKSQLTWMGQWLERTFDSKPEHLKRFLNSILPIKDGHTIELFDRTLTVRFQEQDRKTVGGSIDTTTDELTIKTPKGHKADRKSTSAVISRTLADHYRDHFESKVRSINERSFNQPIRSVRLKNNSSNWGSCSSNGNINLSTRLLLLPEEVQEYVIIHELAHLLELNHSERYWRLVESVLPEYRQYEAWLKKHGQEKVL